MYSIIIVDDEVNTRNGLRDYFDWKNYGIEVVGIADDGRTALSLIHDINPDIVLTDVRMKHMDGIELIQHLYTMEQHPHVIFISAYSDVNLLRSAIQLSAIDYILKPIQFEELAVALKRAIAMIEREQMELHKQQDLLSRLNGINGLIQNQKFQIENLPNIRKDTKCDPSELISNYLQSESDDLLLDYLNDIFINTSSNLPIIYYQNIGLQIILEASKCMTRLTLYSDYIICLEQNTWKIVMQATSMRDIYDSIIFYLNTLCTHIHSHINNNESNTVREAKRYIYNHFNEAITIREVAAHVFLTPTYLCSRFKNETNQTINDYQTAIRIEKACKLMHDPSIKIRDICFAVGYISQSHFNRIFKEYIGKTPSSYQKSVANYY